MRFRKPARACSAEKNHNAIHIIKEDPVQPLIPLLPINERRNNKNTKKILISNQLLYKFAYPSVDISSQIFHICQSRFLQATIYRGSAHPQEPWLSFFGIPFGAQVCLSLRFFPLFPVLEQRTCDGTWSWL